MDIRNPVWFGRFSVTGQKPQLLQGSAISITTECVAKLRLVNPRDSATGKRVTIEISSIPFDSALSPQDRLAAEVESSLDINLESGPRDGENYDSFFLRLLEDGNTLQTARFLANDWFKLPQDTALSAWLTDEKAVRFRQLNASTTAYEGALPNEYDSLKRYVCETYPDQTKEMTFRKA